VLAATLACALLAAAMGLGAWRGTIFGLLSMAGDALSSLAKRRLGRRPGVEFPGLDQLPEALLPLLVLRYPLGLSVLDCGVIAVLFALLDLAAIRLRHR
jgi:CDP-2,3-bis-(O-geranylgeranyl)-sn-glycerol synthase